MTYRKLELFIVFFAILLTVTLTNIQPVSSVATGLRLNPLIVYAEPDEFFKVNLTIHSVEFLYAWQANITFDPEVLRYVGATEGDFLARQPEGTFGVNKTGENYAVIGWSTQGQYVGESGSGILATLEFQVLKIGESPIEIATDPRAGTYTTFLMQQRAINPPPNWVKLNPTKFTVQSSFFINTMTPPTAEFSYSPEIPGINQSITFDASNSTAESPLAIVQYYWDFGDETNATVNTSTTTHNYTNGGDYTVALTVIDNATASETVKSYFNLTNDEMPLAWYELFSTKKEIIEIALPHDVAVTNVSPSKEEVTVGETLSIDVTVWNKGIESEDFDVTAFYDGNEVGTKQVADLNAGDEETLTFDWDTTGVAEGVYQIKAVASAVAGEGNVEDNEFFDGTVTVKTAPEPFPITWIVGGVIGIVVVLVVVFLLFRRKGATST